MPDISLERINIAAIFGAPDRPVLTSVRRRLDALPGCDHVESSAFFGCELKETYDVLTGSISGEDDRLLRRVFSRPSAEAVGLSYSGSGELDLAVFCRLGGALFGRALPLRKSPAHAGPDIRGRTTYFLESPAVEAAYAWMLENFPLSPGDVGGPLSRYIARNLIHPLPDGNGRASRSCLNLELGNVLGWPAGCFLPLYPHFTLARHRLQAAFNDAAFEGRKADLLRSLSDGVTAAAQSKHLPGVAAPGRISPAAKGERK